MSLTVDTGPFSASPAGELNVEFETPTGAVLYWDPVPQRIRAFVEERPGRPVARDAAWAYPKPIAAASFLAGHKAWSG